MYWITNDWVPLPKSAVVSQPWLKGCTLQSSSFPSPAPQVVVVEAILSNTLLFSLHGPRLNISSYFSSSFSFASSTSSPCLLNDDPQNSDLHPSFAFALLWHIHRESLLTPVESKFLSPSQISFQLPDELSWAYTAGCST